MGKALKYIATNIETGETHEGTAGKVAILLGVSAALIYKVQIEGRKVHGKWIIEKEGKRGGDKHSIPQSLLDDWDALTSPIRKREMNQTNI